MVQYQTGIRGTVPSPDKLNLSDLTIQTDNQGTPTQVLCPQGQTGGVKPGSSTDYIAYFDAALCRDCPLHLSQHCRARRVKRDRTRFNWAFSHKEFQWAQRRKRYLALKREKNNPRAAVEATMRSIKQAFPDSRLPVRGQFRVTCMMLAAAAMTNLKRISRYLEGKEHAQKTESSSQEASSDSLISTLSSAFDRLASLWQIGQPCFSF